MSSRFYPPWGIPFPNLRVLVLNMSIVATNQLGALDGGWWAGGHAAPTFPSLERFQCDGWFDADGVAVILRFCARHPWLRDFALCGNCSNVPDPTGLPWGPSLRDVAHVALPHDTLRALAGARDDDADDDALLSRATSALGLRGRVTESAAAGSTLFVSQILDAERARILADRSCGPIV